MCIRDSGYYVGTGRVVLNAENAYKFQASTNLSRKNSAQGILKINPWVIVAAAVLAVILIVVLAVSYTHLDVYKRQALLGGSYEEVYYTPNEVVDSSNVDAVSYTHLAAGDRPRAQLSRL